MRGKYGLFLKWGVDWTVVSQRHTIPQANVTILGASTVFVERQEGLDFEQTRILIIYHNLIAEIAPGHLHLVHLSSSKQRDFTRHAPAMRTHLNFSQQSTILPLATTSTNTPTHFAILFGHFQSYLHVKIHQSVSPTSTLVMKGKGGRKKEKNQGSRLRNPSFQRDAYSTAVASQIWHPFHLA